MTKIIRAFEYTNRDGHAVRFNVSEKNSNLDSTAMSIMYLMMKDDRLTEGEAGEWIDTILSGKSVYSPDTMKRSEFSENYWRLLVGTFSGGDSPVLVTEDEIFTKVSAVDVLYATCQNLRVVTFEWDGNSKLLDVLDQENLDLIDAWEPYSEYKGYTFLVNVG